MTKSLAGQDLNQNLDKLNIVYKGGGAEPEPENPKKNPKKSCGCGTFMEQIKRARDKAEVTQRVRGQSA